VYTMTVCFHTIPACDRETDRQTDRQTDGRRRLQLSRERDKIYETTSVVLWATTHIRPNAKEVDIIETSSDHKE